MRYIALLILVVKFFIPVEKTLAQEKMPKPKAILNHIALYVVDLNKATTFYEEVFELEKIPEPFHDGKHTWFSLGSAGQLHIIQGANGQCIFDKNEHLCFSVGSVNVFVKALKSKNISFENWAGNVGGITLRADGVKQIYFKDPDGHWLEVNDAK
ncbi:VOC family protein [Pedobacter fastidiosus]|nr:VOC family protein [Pedobacter fastidiosus]